MAKRRRRFRYDLFISYSTDPDYPLMRSLEPFLETFHLLPTPSHLTLLPLEVVVDAAEFAMPPGASQSVETIIEDRLAQSAELLLLCSAGSARSQWVDREVAWFLEHRGKAAIRVAVSEGVDPAGQSSEVFSKRMIDAGLHRDIFYDFRGFRSRECADWQKVRHFDDERTRLAADLQGVTAGEVRPIWYRERARVSEKNARFERAHRLSVLSTAEPTPERKLMLAVAAANTHRHASEEPLPVAEEALRRGLERMGGTALSGLSDITASVAFTECGRWLLTGSAEFALRAYDLESSDPAASAVTPRREEDYFSCNFLPIGDGMLLQTTFSNDARLWDISRGDPSKWKSHRLRGHTERIDRTLVSPDQRWLVTTAAGEALALWRLQPGTNPSRSRLSGHERVIEEFPMRRVRCIGAAAFDARSKRLATGGADGRLLVWDLTAEKPQEQPENWCQHTSEVTALEWSKDGRWLASGFGDGSIRLFSLDGGESREPRVFQVPEYEVASLHFGHGGESLVARDRMRSFVHWDLRSLVEPQGRLLVKEKSIVVDAALNKDGDSFRVTTIFGTNRIFDLRSGDPSQTDRVLQGMDEDLIDKLGMRGYEVECTGSQQSDDDHWLVNSDSRGVVYLWDLQTDNPAAAKLELLSAGTSAAISPNGRWLVTGSNRLWDLRRPHFQARQPAVAPSVGGGPVHRIDAIPGSDWLAVKSYSSTAQLLTPRDLSRAHALDHDDIIESVDMSRNGRWLATGGRDRLARLWDLSKPDPTQDPILLTHDEAVLCVAFAPDGRWLASGGYEGPFFLWPLGEDARPGERIAISRRNSGSPKILFTPDGSRVLTADGNTATLRSVRGAGAPGDLLSSFGDHDYGMCMALSEDGRWFATGAGDGRVRVWRLDAKDVTQSCRILRRSEGGSGIGKLCFVPGGGWLAAFSFDERALLWRIHSKGFAETVTVPPPEDEGDLRERDLVGYLLEASPDGRWLAFARTDKPATLVDLHSSQDKPNSILLRGHQAGFDSLAFSPDSRWLLSGSADRGVRSWRLDGDAPPLTSVLVGRHATFVNRVSWSHDSRWIISSAYDGEIHLAPTGVEDLIHDAQAALGRNFTEDEWTAMFPGESYERLFPNLP